MKTPDDKVIVFLGLLQILFMGLKLIHVIKWSWIVVFCPTWFFLGIIVIAILISIVVGILYEEVDTNKLN